MLRTKLIFGLLSLLFLLLVMGLLCLHWYAHLDTEAQKGAQLFGIFLVLAGAEIVYLLTIIPKRIFSPLAMLKSSIQQVGEGDLDQQVAPICHDEFGLLSDSFNKMVLQLRSSNEASARKFMRLDETMQKTLTSFPDPIFVLNSEGIMGFRNPSADSLAVRLLFAGVNRLPDQVQQIVAEVWAADKDYLPISYKESIKFRFNQADVYFMPRVILLRDDHGVAFGTAVILEDITHLRQMSEMKSNLVSTVSHELKTPLTGLRLSAYLLEERSLGPLNETQLDLVTNARQAADRMLSMLNDFLNLTRLEESVPTLNLKVVPPEKLVAQAIEVTSALAHESGIKVLTGNIAGFPSVLVDPERIAHVFNNLIGNAIKYSPALGEVLVSVEKLEAHRVRFSVRDKGPGIPHQYQSRIFEKFYRVPDSIRSGTGLGLAIAREIVEAHGGEIGLSSAPGEGSEFYVLLPSAENTSSIENVTSANAKA